jgi:hypothetical protein
VFWPDSQRFSNLYQILISYYRNKILLWSVWTLYGKRPLLIILPYTTRISLKLENVVLIWGPLESWHGNLKSNILLIDVKKTVQESVKTSQIVPRTIPFPSFWFFWLYSENNYFVCFLLQAQMEIFFKIMKFIAHRRYHAGLNAFNCFLRKGQSCSHTLF